MARRIGGYADWTWPRELEESVRQAMANVDDLSVPMERASKLGFDEISARLASGGDGDWPALSPATIARWGSHTAGHREGGFEATLRRDWSRRNFVVFTRASHAHLFGEGTVAHYVQGTRTSVYSANGKHRSRAQARKLLTSATHSQRNHQPARAFMFFSESVRNRFGQIFLDHLLQPFGRAAA